MATWVAHFRIAENLLRREFDVEKIPFVIGNIGPDSGVPNEDWSNFDPPKKLTHWEDDNKEMRPEAFYETYIKDRMNEISKEKFSFYMGYYFHLLADVEWSKMIHEKKMTSPMYVKKMKEDPKFIWEVKKDWYGLDFVYLMEHEDSIFFTCFQYIENVPNYLDYFPNGAFEKKVAYITEFYLKNLKEVDRPFIYLSKQEMDDYVERTTEVIEKVIKEKISIKSMYQGKI